MRNLLIGVIVGLMVTTVAPTTATPALWIWRDRWNVIGSAFQDGYITGVFDAVQQLGLNFNSVEIIRWVHSGIADRFPTIKSAVEWTDAGVAKGTDPLQIVADLMISRLIRYRNGYDEDDMQSSAPVSRIGFIWKDRWVRNYSEVLYGKFFCDGYVAGVFDIVRSLDNAGKSPTVLRADVQRAAGMLNRLEARTHQKNLSLGSVLRAIRSAISRSEDPTENMAMAIFEAMRKY